MRLYIKLSKNTELIPFNYQHMLTGVVHKWIGEKNQEHGKRSLYSFSWLQNTVANKNGINLNRDAYFFISAYDDTLIKQVVKGILKDPEMFCGSRVIDIQIREVPEFSNEERFFLNSPILIRKREGERTRHVTYLEEDFETLLMENIKSKLQLVGLDTDDMGIELDKSYAFPQTKLVNYKGIKNKTSLAPIIIKGSREQIAFAWAVGLGNSTGIGFGSVK
ncbi:CRISPR-associated endoribonuclease Cas6 [Niabella insulamsoli]|uniref:CRISPR-associated endoribonuclease Cas6 n=1 Tax=Niabella insulamsoli TaxID=3144874 RepID=UPI0031FC2576